MSSLFSQEAINQFSTNTSASTSASQPSIFSNLGGSSASSQPAQNTSIFANLGASKSEENKNPFGNLGGSSQPGQTSNIFGNLGTSNAEETKNPFGNLGGSSQPQSTSSGSIFDAPKPSKLGGSSLLSNAPPLGGGDTTTSAPFGGSLFSNTANTSAPAASSLFSTQPNQQFQASQSQQPNGQSTTTGSQPAFFNSLLEKGKKRTHDATGGSGFADLPSLQLGLGDIAKRARELGSTGIRGPKGVPPDSRAHYLLAASGVKPGASRRDIESLSSQPFVGSTQPRTTEWDPDTSKYINQMQQQSTLKMIEEGIQRAHKNFDLFLEETVDINWDLQRKKIYEHFGLAKASSALDETSRSTPGANTGSFGRSTRRGRGGELNRPGQDSLKRTIFGASSLQKSVIGSPSVQGGGATLFADVAEKGTSPPNAQNDRFTREKQAKYAEKVQTLNRARLQEVPYPVIQGFLNVENERLGDTPSQLVDAYKALIEITKEKRNPGAFNDPDVPKERQFADDYLDETPNSAKAIKIRKRILDGSRRCLEKAFFQELESTVAKNPKEANIGGVPTTTNKVRAYIRIQEARRELIPDLAELQRLGDDYCWAYIFFLLRCGLVKEAADYVTSNSSAFRALDRNFITYITAYASSADRRLPRQIQDRINAEYQQRSRLAPENSVDPYRMACYKVIGRCELSKMRIDSVSQGIEDWIWLQFCLAREVNRVDEAAGEIHGLEEVRETIREIGQRYFSKGSEGMGGYGTYFFLQILGGMFEQAVSYLYSYSYVAAVHFAIALDYYGLLRVSDFSVSDTELLTYNTKDLPQISFGRMLGYYTRDFRAGNTEAAVDYLTLICLNADLPGAMGKSQAALCHEALRELVLETREFAQLLGDIQGDGTRLKGDVELRLKLINLEDQEDFLKNVTLQAASVADDNGRTTDAVLLYHLAEDYDNVTTILNRVLSEAISVDIGEVGVRLQPLKPRQELPNQQQPAANSSLSLTSVDDPSVLARNMIGLYNSNALYYQKIRTINRETCGILLRMEQAKVKVANGQWAEAIDEISPLNLLPLHASGSIPTIRNMATSFNALTPPISRNIGPLLLWTITCIGKQREALQLGSQFENATRRAMGEELMVAAKDLMVFAGLVKYRLGERVWAAVTGAGGEVGVY